MQLSFGDVMYCCAVIAMPMFFPFFFLCKFNSENQFINSFPRGKEVKKVIKLKTKDPAKLVHFFKLFQNNSFIFHTIFKATLLALNSLYCSHCMFWSKPSCIEIVTKADHYESKMNLSMLLV